MRDVGFRTAFELCSMVDELDPSATGELVIIGPGGPRGTVFVEHGRVCWAAARGLSRRLTELLFGPAGMSQCAMEELLLACRAQHVPLGESLVDRGVLGASELRAALLQHTIESLHHLCSRSLRAAWRPRSGTSYSPRFTFPTAELLTHSGGIIHAELAGNLRPKLASMFGAEDSATAFVRVVDSALPAPIATHGAIACSATSMVATGRWALSALDLISAFNDERALLCVTRDASEKNGMLLAFREGDVVVTAETSAQGSARLLNLRAEQRRKG